MVKKSIWKIILMILFWWVLLIVIVVKGIFNCAGCNYRGEKNDKH